MKLFSILSVLILLSACSNQEVLNDRDEQMGGAFDCVFQQVDSDLDGVIDESERGILDDCFENRLMDRDAILENLIGEWHLVGHGQSWILTPSQPCGRLIFDANRLEVSYTSSYLDTIFTSNWELGQSQFSSYFIKLENPFYPVTGLSNFCLDYMFFDDTPLDGNMYIYEKQ